MAIRLLVYSHVTAVALIATAFYLDRCGLPDEIEHLIFAPAAVASMSLIVYPFLTPIVLLFSTSSRREKLMAFLAEIPITFAHWMAVLPAVQ